MEKTLQDTDQKEKQDVSEWSFPHMDLTVKDTIFHITEAHHEVEQNETIEKEDPAVLEHQAAKLEIENIKKEYFRKIAILNHVLSQIEKPLAALDQELIDILQEILTGVIKKIIFKELQTDPELMKKIIEELCLLVQAQDGALNVFLSEEDFKKVSADFSQPSTILKVNPSLTEGDIIVKSNMNEVHAKLADRINNLLSTKND